MRESIAREIAWQAVVSCGSLEAAVGAGRFEASAPAVLEVGAATACSPSWNQTRLRPAFFAAYRASSARADQSQGIVVAADLGHADRNGDLQLGAAVTRGTLMAMAERIRSPARIASASGVAGRMMANSSPP